MMRLEVDCIVTGVAGTCRHLLLIIASGIFGLIRSVMLTSIGVFTKFLFALRAELICIFAIAVQSILCKLPELDGIFTIVFDMSWKPRFSFAKLTFGTLFVMNSDGSSTNSIWPSTDFTCTLLIDLLRFWSIY